MKTILKTLSLLCLLFLLGGCIEETEPTAFATPGQINKNPAALEATITGICSAVHKSYFALYSTYPFDFGYEAMCQIRDLYCQDMPVINAQGWDWFSAWSRNQSMGERYLYAQVVWNYYWAFLKTANDAIGIIDPKTENPTYRHYLGIAKCFRALAYLDMARMYEFKPNKYTSAPEVEGLTVQFVTPGMTEAEARNNPRVTKAKMAEFILADLRDAVSCLDGYEPAAKSFPDRSVAYGLMARTYLWLEDYEKAKTAAQDALAAGAFTPLSLEEWHSTTSGFNSSDNASWMWADMISPTDPTLTNGGSLCSWVSWCSNEASFGYSGYAGGLRAADRSFYERISDTDFRKYSFLAPKDSPLRAKTVFCSSTSRELIARFADYISVKFRPGQGNTTVPTIGGAVDFPLMRCEEMHFIIAECDARDGISSTLADFMKSYRDEKYTCGKTGDDLIEEVIFQKRVEFWGEGLVYFDFKRLGMGVTRGYKGTNHFVDYAAYNTDGLAPWMNQCAVSIERSENQAFVNNPDPTGKVPFWSDTSAPEE